MKNFSALSLFMFILAFLAGCNSPEVTPTDQAQDANAKKTPSTSATLLKDVLVQGTLENGYTFEGKVTITRFSYDQVKGLLVDGFLKGDVIAPDGTETDVKQAFTGVEATLVNGSAGGRTVATAATCQILFLDLGPIFLDVLGLQVDLSRIVLDISAVTGSNALLGNLLCAVTGLLDPLNGLLLLIENLSQLLDLLQQINQLLG